MPSRQLPPSSTTSKYSSNFSRSKPPSCSDQELDCASPCSIDYGLPVFMIMNSKCIHKLTHLQPPSSHDYGLQVYLQSRSITTSSCISEFIQSWPPSASLRSLRHCLHQSVSPTLVDHSLQVLLNVHSSILSRYSPNCAHVPFAASSIICI